MNLGRALRTRACAYTTHFRMRPRQRSYYEVCTSLASCSRNARRRDNVDRYDLTRSSSFLGSEIHPDACAYTVLDLSAKPDAARQRVYIYRRYFGAAARPRQTHQNILLYRPVIS